MAARNQCPHVDLENQPIAFFIPCRFMNPLVWPHAPTVEASKPVNEQRRLGL